MSRLLKLSPTFGNLPLWAALAVLAVGLGLSAIFFEWYPLLAVCGLLLAVVGWQNPRLALIGLLLAVTFVYWFTTDLLILPDEAKYIKEALIALLFARGLFEALVNRTFLRTPLEKWLLLFAALGLLSGLVNQTSPLVIAVALRGLFQYALVFYAIIWLRRYFDDRFIRRYFSVAIALGLLELVIAAWQYLSSPGSIRGVDIFRGTLGISGSNNLGLYVLPALCYVMSRMLDSRQWRWQNLFLAVGLLLVPVWASSRMAWLVLAIAMGLMWWRRVTLTPRGLMFIAGLLAVASALLYASVTFIAQTSDAWANLTVGRVVSIRGAIASFATPGEGVGLTAWAPLVWDTVIRESPVPLLGLGPGSGGSSAAVQLNTATYRRYFFDYFRQRALNRPGDLPTQVLQTGAEYGPFGPLLLLIIAFEFFLLAHRLRRTRRSPQAMALGAALVVSAVTMVVLSIKDGIWEQQTVSMWMWILGGLVYAYFRRTSAAGRPPSAAGGRNVTGAAP
jgi:hypothetical protein